MKFKEDDKVTIRLTRLAAAGLNQEACVYFSKREIVEHTPAPFKWCDVELGMAFLYKKQTVYFVGRTKRGAEVFSMEGHACPQSLDLYNLVRSPDRDLEMQVK